MIEATFVSLSFGHYPRLLKNVVGGSFAIVSCVVMLVSSTVQRRLAL